jgi:ABC-type Fe3+ transport system permease subunit
VQDFPIVEVVRAAGVGLLCATLGYAGAAALGTRSRPLRRMAWAAALLAFFAPSLLAGYAYGDFSGVIHASATQRAGFHGLLMLLKLLPVASVIWLMRPAGVGLEAWHCLRLAAKGMPMRTRLWHGWQLLRQGWLAPATVAFGVVFLLVYGEFELAAFLSVKQWTVALFDAQVGGMHLSQTLRLAALPVSLSAVVAMALFAGLAGAGRFNGAHAPRTQGYLLPGVGALLLSAGVVMLLLIPGGTVLWNARAGAARLITEFALYRELITSIAVAAIAATLACALAAWFLPAQSGKDRTGRWRWVLLAAALLPGLLGGLVVALGTLSLIQLPPLLWLRETPLPLLLAAAVIILPEAILLRLLVRNWTATSDVHVARLLRASPARSLRQRAVGIEWARCSRAKFWMAALLVCRIFQDITLASLLAPIRLPLVAPRLYNFMHYGRSQMLSASLLGCMLAPIVVLASAGVCYRLGRSWHAATLDI